MEEKDSDNKCSLETNASPNQSSITLVNLANVSDSDNVDNVVAKDTDDNDNVASKTEDETKEQVSPKTRINTDNATKRVLSTKDNRHFQKTRSFSAVEENPEKKVTTERLRAIPDFPLKDVAHSRSEQLETQSLQQQKHDVKQKENDLNQLAASNKVVDQSDDYLKTPSSSTIAPDKRGDTLIMQFDYFSNDQPMSLQHDPRFDCSIKQSKGNHLRKSGRDLTELESNVARGISKDNRSRPRLANTTNSFTNNYYFYSYTFIPTISNSISLCMFMLHLCHKQLLLFCSF